MASDWKDLLRQAGLSQHIGPLLCCCDVERISPLCGRVTAAFQDESIDSGSFALLSSEDLVNLGVHNLGERKRILQIVGDLSTDSPRMQKLEKKVADLHAQVLRPAPQPPHAARPDPLARRYKSYP